MEPDLQENPQKVEFKVDFSVFLFYFRFGVNSPNMDGKKMREVRKYD